MFWIKPVSVILSILVGIGAVILSILTIMTANDLNDAARYDEFDVKFPVVAFNLAIAAGVMTIPTLPFLFGLLHPVATCIQMGYSALVAILTIVARQLIVSWMGQYSDKELYDLLKYTDTNRHGRRVNYSYAVGAANATKFLLGIFVLLLIGMVLVVAFVHEDLYILFWDIRYRIEFRRVNAERKRRQKQRASEIQMVAPAAATEHRGQPNLVGEQSSAAQPNFGRARVDSEETLAVGQFGASAC